MPLEKSRFRRPYLKEISDLLTQYPVTVEEVAHVQLETADVEPDVDAGYVEDVEAFLFDEVHVAIRRYVQVS